MPTDPRSAHVEPSVIGTGSHLSAGESSNPRAARCPSALLLAYTPALRPLLGLSYSVAFDDDPPAPASQPPRIARDAKRAQAGEQFVSSGRRGMMGSSEPPDAQESNEAELMRLIAAGDRWIDASIAANGKSRRRARLVWRRAA